jgi:predicted RNA methylase
MRLAGQAKLGYFPASPIAIDGILKHLYARLPSPEKRFDTTNIIDPCAGEGVALNQLRKGLGIPAEQTYAVELDAGRTEKIKENIPGVNLLGPASFIGVQITGYSFGIAYVNPPFDFEMGGGRREEQAFTEKATRLLCHNGILVLVCPIGALSQNRKFCEFLDSHFTDIAVYKFPDGEDEDGKSIRGYREIVVFGKKRKDQVPQDKLNELGTLHKMQMHWGYVTIQNLPSLGQNQPIQWYNGSGSYDKEEDIRTWEVPLAWKPHTFKKTMFTDEELLSVIDESPLNRILEEVQIQPPARPPLPLDKGHLGLILASGMLDGVVEGPHGVHVVRGSSHKIKYHNVAASSSEANPETGAVTTKDVFSERPVTVIRCAEQNGNIATFSNDTKPDKEEENHET